jgi:hypothetical protein
MDDQSRKRAYLYPATRDRSLAFFIIPAAFLLGSLAVGSLLEHGVSWRTLGVTVLAVGAWYSFLQSFREQPGPTRFDITGKGVVYTLLGFAGSFGSVALLGKIVI